MKVFALAFNFPKRAEEFGKNQTNEIEFFHKGDSVLRPNMPFFLPEWAEEVEAGIEIAVKIKRVGKYIAERFAHRYYDEVTLALDITEPKLLNEAISKGKPWSKAKVFDNSLALGNWVDKEVFAFPHQHCTFALHQNGQECQQGNTEDMCHHIDAVIAEISQYHTLKIGDIILLGSPANAPRLAIGDKLEGFISGNKLLEVEIK